MQNISQLKKTNFKSVLPFTTALILFFSCSKPCDDCNVRITAEVQPTPVEGRAIISAFGGKIDPNNLHNYANQPVPEYIRWDNGKENPIYDESATLGRVLFYDLNLSIDNSISCASCHHQAFAFGDTAVVSRGVEGGLTGRHSMRLVNARFSAEKKFFWDERAETLEDQTTMPMKDHAELGWSGENGRPNFDDLLDKLQSIDYYQELFTMTYGDETITEARLQTALAHFVRSIQSFDSKYDEGYLNDFRNFTESEKRGHELFTTSVRGIAGSRTGGGLNCFECHRPPAFDINPNGGNNGNIRVANDPAGIDLDNTKSPTLRDLENPDGQLNGPMMHDGSLNSFRELINFQQRNNFSEVNTKRDPLFGSGSVVANISRQEGDDLIAFLRTLTGKNVYVDERWSDPFK